MHFYSGEIGHGEHFREQRADVVEMRENAVGIGVAFTAENFVAVNGKPVEKVLFLGRGFLNETREPGFDRLQFSRMHFEIGMKADEICESAHVRKVSPRANLSNSRRANVKCLDATPFPFRARKVSPRANLSNSRRANVKCLDATPFPFQAEARCYDARGAAVRRR